MPAMADPAAALDSLRRLVRALRVSTRAVERSVGVSSAQLFVLQRLLEAPGSSLAELARLTLTDASSVSVVVSRLVARGLVARTVDERDRRRAALSVTTAGRALARRAPEPAQARLVAALSSLPRAQLAAVTRGLGAIVRAMGVDGEPATMFFEEELPASRRRGARRAPSRGS
jgi:DNA-binding MarR family transcriptional regulator